MYSKNLFSNWQTLTKAVSFSYWNISHLLVGWTILGRSLQSSVAEVRFNNLHRGHFSNIFFHGKSLSMEFSSEYLGKTICLNFFHGKFHFSLNFFFGGGGDFQRNFQRNFLQKKCTKNQPLEPILRLRNLQLQRQRCCRLERFSK
jgi:hypothetical protein